jgi:hypothetical protein
MPGPIMQRALDEMARYPSHRALDEARPDVAESLDLMGDVRSNMTDALHAAVKAMSGASQQAKGQAEDMARGRYALDVPYVAGREDVYPQMLVGSPYAQARFESEYLPSSNVPAPRWDKATMGDRGTSYGTRNLATAIPEWPSQRHEILHQAIARLKQQQPDLVRRLLRQTGRVHDDDFDAIRSIYSPRWKEEEALVNYLARNDEFATKFVPQLETPDYQMLIEKANELTHPALWEKYFKPAYP